MPATAATSPRKRTAIATCRAAAGGGRAQHRRRLHADQPDAPSRRLREPRRGLRADAQRRLRRRFPARSCARRPAHGTGRSSATIRPIPTAAAPTARSLPALGRRSGGPGARCGARTPSLRPAALQPAQPVRLAAPAAGQRWPAVLRSAAARRRARGASSRRSARASERRPACCGASRPATSQSARVGTGCCRRRRLRTAGPDAAMPRSRRCVARRAASSDCGPATHRLAARWPSRRQSRLAGVGGP